MISLTNRTKQALAQSLEKQLQTKNIDKITINDITKECGINRMTFYYHFKDIFDLADWAFRRKYLSILITANPDNWAEGLDSLFEYVQSHKQVIMNMYNSTYRDNFEAYFMRITEKMFAALLTRLSLDNMTSEKNIRFITKYHTTALTGLLIRWLREGMKESPEKILPDLQIMLPSILKASIEIMNKS